MGDFELALRIFALGLVLWGLWALWDSDLSGTSVAAEGESNDEGGMRTEGLTNESLPEATTGSS